MTTDNHPTLPLMPVRLGHYQLRYHIATGGFGEVYRATDTLTGLDVAIKCLRRDLTMASDQRERFQREAQLASRVQSPNVVRVLDFAVDPGGLAYIVMEFVDGGSLADRLLYGQRQFSAAEMDVLALDIAEGMAAIHAAGRAGMVHGDLKPANVLIDAASGSARVTDFGVARSIATTATLPPTGWIGATLAYAAPEVLNGLTPTPAADVWSAGVILLELLLNAPPFRAPPPQQILVDQLIASSVPASAGHLRPVIERCLRIDAAKRFANGQELATAIRAAGHLPGDRRQVRSALAMAQSESALAKGSVFVPPPPVMVQPAPPTPHAPSARPAAPSGQDRSAKLAPIAFVATGIAAAALLAILVLPRLGENGLAATPTTEATATPAPPTSTPATPTATPTQTATFTPTATATPSPTATPSIAGVGRAQRVGDVMVVLTEVEFRSNSSQANSAVRYRIEFRNTSDVEAQVGFSTTTITGVDNTGGEWGDYYAVWKDYIDDRCLFSSSNGLKPYIEYELEIDAGETETLDFFLSPVGLDGSCSGEGGGGKSRAELAVDYIDIDLGEVIMRTKGPASRGEPAWRLAR